MLKIKKFNAISEKHKPKKSCLKKTHDLKASLSCLPPSPKMLAPREILALHHNSQAQFPRILNPSEYCCIVPLFP